MAREMIDMTDQETAQYLRKWVLNRRYGTFEWPTDACGYRQHIRFVDYRNTHWKGKPQDFNQFVLDYASTLEATAR